MSGQQVGSEESSDNKRGKVSSFCQDGGCVSVEMIQFVDGLKAFVSNTVDGSSEFDRAEWEAFIAGVKNDEFDWGKLVSGKDGA